MTLLLGPWVFGDREIDLVGGSLNNSNTTCGLSLVGGHTLPCSFTLRQLNNLRPEYWPRIRTQQ